MESYDMRLKKVNFLKSLKQYKAEERPIIYTDETYFHSSHTTPMSWTDNSTKMLKNPILKGKR